MNRRTFLGALALAACHKAMPKPVIATPKQSPKSILVLGGTNFLGPHVVRAALARGHTITLFNRGKTHAELFPEVEKLHGDRDGKLDALKGRTWDAVVDTSGFVPRIVKMSAELLASSVKQYIFISTISVYADPTKPGADETAPLQTTPEPESEDVPKYYGALKALCEKAAEAAMPGRVANIRPGLIVGPGDPTGRFTHWPSRCAAGGEVLAPGDGTGPVQLIDGRDLGDWIVHVIEQGTTGTFNAMGPAKKLTLREMLDACNAAAGNKAKLTWVDTKFLEEQKVEPWSELPLWVPTDLDPGFGTTSNARAIAAGLTFRPILETAKDTIAWLSTLDDAAVQPGGSPQYGKAVETAAEKRAKMISSGISRDKELAVLAAWHAARDSKSRTSIDDTGAGH